MLINIFIEICRFGKNVITYQANHLFNILVISGIGKKWHKEEKEAECFGFSIETAKR